MAAIAYPTTDDCGPRPPQLRVVRPARGERSGRPRRPERPERSGGRAAGSAQPASWLAPRPRAVYRRRRLAVVLVSILAGIGLLSLGRAVVGVFGGGPLTSSEPPAVSMRPVAATTYVVRPGDTLWTIAKALHPSGDPRPLVDRLAAQQHGRPLQPGEHITLP